MGLVGQPSSNSASFAIHWSDAKCGSEGLHSRKWPREAFMRAKGDKLILSGFLFPKDATTSPGNELL